MRRLPAFITSIAVTVIAVAGGGTVVVAQGPVRPARTAADWAALAKLPDFSGVWEISLGGGGRGRGAGGGRGAAPAGPQWTPDAEARRKAALAKPPEDNQTANCVPPGMPGIMGQPYPMEFLMTPGKVT